MDFIVKLFPVICKEDGGSLEFDRTESRWIFLMY